MATKHEALLGYYEGLKIAMVTHMASTEKGLRALRGVDAGEIEKLVGAVRKKHQKLLKRLEGRLEGEIQALGSHRS